MRVPCTPWNYRQHPRGFLHRSMHAILTGMWDCRSLRCIRSNIEHSQTFSMLSRDRANRQSGRSLYYRPLEPLPRAVEESSATNPVCCATRDSSAFIPAAHAQGPDLMKCRRCGCATYQHHRDRAREGRERIALSMRYAVLFRLCLLIGIVSALVEQDH